MDDDYATDAKSIMGHAKQAAMPQAKPRAKPGTGPGWDRPIFGAPPGGLETWVRVMGPDSQVRTVLTAVYGPPVGWIVVTKSGCMLRPVGPVFATEAEAIEYAAGVPVPAAPTRLVTR